MRSIFSSMLPSRTLPQRTLRPRNLKLLSRPVERRFESHWAIMCDIDHFKSYNDVYGQAAGDEVLRTVADALAKSCRGDDQVYGRDGEEFVIIVPGDSLERARACAERHRRAVEALQIPHEGSPFGVVTVSMGLATIISSGTDATAAALEEADAALYRAKRAGRNQVAAAPGLALA